MPLPTSPDSSGPDPVSEFVGTGRVYYPIPHLTRMINYNGSDYKATLDGLSIYQWFPDGEIQMRVDYLIVVKAYSNGRFKFRRKSMDLNEWNKLPPVPQTNPNPE